MPSDAVLRAVQIGAEAAKQRADARAADAARQIAAIDGSDRMSLREIAAALNARGIPAARGGEWHGETVARVKQRTPGLIF